MITTEAFDIANSQVVEPTVRDLYLFGNAAVPDTPYGNANWLGDPSLTRLQLTAMRRRSAIARFSIFEEMPSRSRIPHTSFHG